MEAQDVGRTGLPVWMAALMGISGNMGEIGCGIQTAAPETICGVSLHIDPLLLFWFHPPFLLASAFRPAHNCFCFFCSHTVRSLTVYINRIPEQQRRMEKAHMEAVCPDLWKEPVRTIYNRSVLHSRCSHYWSLTDCRKTAQTLIQADVQHVFLSQSHLKGFLTRWKYNSDMLFMTLFCNPATFHKCYEQLRQDVLPGHKFGWVMYLIILKWVFLLLKVLLCPMGWFLLKLTDFNFFL